MASRARGHVGLSRKQEELIAALLSASTVEQAARQVGVGYRTAHRWLQQDLDFQAAYRQARMALVKAAQGQLLRATGRAVEALLDVLDDPLAQPSSKVSAARTILEQAARIIEMDDLESRITALELATGKPGLNGASLVR